MTNKEQRTQLKVPGMAPPQFSAARPAAEHEQSGGKQKRPERILRLEPDLLEPLVELGFDKRQSVNSLINEAIRLYLKDRNRVD